MTSRPDRTADDETTGLRAWMREAAQPIATDDPDAGLDDLRPVSAWIGEPALVGLGEAVRGVRTGRELYRMKHRLLRLLVEDHGIRVVVLEDTPEIGRRLDAFVRAGDGDARSILADAWGPWQTVEFLDTVTWLRGHNRRRPDRPVGVVGADEHAPGTVAANTLAVVADGDPAAYWGGMAHVAVIGDEAWPGEGWAYRRELGERYVAIGLTCDHAVAGEPLPPPPPQFFEATLSATGLERFALDLRRDGGDPLARRWLDRPTRTRIIGPAYEPGADEDHALTGAPAEWLDIVVHTDAITPARRPTGRSAAPAPRVRRR